MEIRIEEKYSQLPVFCMMVGLPASGKSAIADSLVFAHGENNKIPVVCSSDSLRKELYGDENDQSHNNELFVELHKRIKNCLRNGDDVVYDATNISKKRRIAFLKELKNIECHKLCVAAMADYDECLERNAERERKVPEEVIKKMYMNWCPPATNEGFDRIVILYTQNMNDTYGKDRHAEYVKKAKDFDQENSHHTLSLLEHCGRACEYIAEVAPENYILQIAALLHDCGKIFTKTRVNARGIDDGECHYYQHQCVGAYDALMMLPAHIESAHAALYVSNLIYYHMMPYTAWKSSNRAKERDRKLLGDEMMAEIMLLHEADFKAH